MNRPAQILQQEEQTERTEHKAVILRPIEIPDYEKKPEKNIKAPSENQETKKPRKKSEVYTYTPEDLKRMMTYFKEREMWLHYLVFVMSCNMARRIGDILALTWGDLYDSKTGEIKEYLEIKEAKTNKLTHLKINSAVVDAIKLYIKESGCDPAKDNYSIPVFRQYTGTHKGNVLTYSGCMYALKKAAEELGIKYNVGTHSGRKTFGKISRMIHPNDYDSMQILQYVLNHSSEKTTSNYIGLTQEKADKYGDDMGDFFTEYVIGDKEFAAPENKPVITMYAHDLLDLLTRAYDMGMNNAGNEDYKVHTEAVMELFSSIEEISR